MTLSKRPSTGIIIPVKDEPGSNGFEMVNGYRTKHRNTTVTGKISLKSIDSFSAGPTGKSLGSTGAGRKAAL